MTELDTLTTPTDDDLLHLAAARARLRLLEAPTLVGYVRALMVPAMGGAQDGMPRAASKTPPLPLRADAIDDTDDVWSRLLYWVNYWATIYRWPRRRPSSCTGPATRRPPGSAPRRRPPAPPPC